MEFIDELACRFYFGLAADPIVAAFSLGASSMIVLRFGVRRSLCPGLVMAAMGLTLPVRGLSPRRRMSMCLFVTPYNATVRLSSILGRH